MRFISGFLLTLVFTFLIILIAAPNSFSSGSTCSFFEIENLTKGFKGSSTSPSISSDGRFVAFESQTEITEENPGGTYQIFVYDSLSGNISQITNYKDEGSVAPAISGDGAYVAFVSGADIDGKNPDGLNLIYLYNLKSGELTQITTEGNSFEPSVSFDGSQVVFSSNMDSPDGPSAIFLYDGLSGTTTEISDSSQGWSTNPRISGSGKFVVYESTPEITGPEAGKNSEIYIYDVVSGSTSQIELSNTVVGNISPSTNADGRIVAFQSDSNADGNNLNGAFNIYLYNSESGKIKKVTNEPDAGSAGPSVNANGTLVAFQSSGNFSDENPDGDLEIFLYDIISPDFVQITHADSGIQNTGAVLSSGSLNLTFVSENSSEAQNPTQKSDINLVMCTGEQSAGTSPDWINWLILAAAFLLVIYLLGKFRKQKKS